VFFRTGDNFLVFFRTGDNFFKETIGEKLDGRQIFARKTGRATRNFLVDGRDRNIARPFIREGVYSNKCGRYPVQKKIKWRAKNDNFNTHIFLEILTFWKFFCIPSPPYKRTGDQFLVFFRTGDNFLGKNWTREKRPSFYTEEGV